MTPGSNDNFINFIFKETKDDAPDKQLATSTLDRLLLIHERYWDYHCSQRHKSSDPALLTLPRSYFRTRSDLKLCFKLLLKTHFYRFSPCFGPQFTPIYEWICYPTADCVSVCWNMYSNLQHLAFIDTVKHFVILCFQICCTNKVVQ